MQEDLFLVSMMESNERELADDWQQMKMCYPKNARRYFAAVEDACDRMEYEGSTMHANILDRESVIRIARRIEQDMGENVDFDLLLTLLCHEIYVRRCRKRNRCRMFTDGLQSGCVR